MDGGDQTEIRGCGEGTGEIFIILEMENNQTNRQARSDPVS